MEDVPKQYILFNNGITVLNGKVVVRRVQAIVRVAHFPK
jgi:hypothetical protein